MAKLPKLKIRSLYTSKNRHAIYDLEQAKVCFNYANKSIVMLEGHMVISHKDLIKLASQEPYKDKEFLEVVLLPIITGG